MLTRINYVAAIIAFFVVLPACLAHAAPKRPNILLAISDDQSWMHAGAYGLDKSTKTPAFDRIAREGVRFNYAYCAAPSCAPSRSALLTGRHIWQLEEGGLLFGALKAKYTLVTHALEDAGYQTASTGKTYGPGRYDRAFGRPLFGKTFNKHKLADRRPGRSSLDYATNFETFFKQRDKGKPFFFWYGSSEPHQLFDVGGWQKAGKKLEDALVPKCLPDHPVTRGEFLDYGIEIEHFDTHLARMIAILEEAGELDNTIIIVTSDHGNPMPRSKANLYDSGARVPLAIRFPPKVTGSRVVDDFVGLWELAPTVLELAGAEVPKSVTGRSLLPVLTSKASGQVDPKRDSIVTAFERHIICRRDGLGYPMRSIRTHKWAFIRNYAPDRWPAGDPDFNSSHQGFLGDCDKGESKHLIMGLAHDPKYRGYYNLCFGRRPAEELYDMAADPHQLRNLAADPKHAEVKEQLEARMKAFLSEQGDQRMRGESPWDDYPFTDQRIFKHPDWRTGGFPTPVR